MNNVLADILLIGGGIAIAAFVIGLHIAAVMDKRRMQRKCDMYKRYYEQCYEQKMTKEREG